MDSAVRRVLSQTPILPNAPTYLMLSKLADQPFQATHAYPPTCKIEFNAADLDHSELGEAGSASASSGHIISKKTESSSVVSNSEGQDHKSNNDAGLGNNKLTTSQSSQTPSSSISVAYQSRKIRKSGIEVAWYSSKNNSLSFPLPNVQPKPEIGHLYLHHPTDHESDQPSIWIFKLGSNGRNQWVKIDKGYRYTGQTLDGVERFLSISKNGRPSYNKKNTNAQVPTKVDVRGDRDSDAEEGED